MRRGEVWWAELPPPVGSRPVVVLTRDAVLHSIDSVVVVLVTRTVRNLPTEVLLGRRQGLATRCVANFDNLLTAPRRRLKRQMGACASEKVREINDALKAALDIPHDEAPQERLLAAETNEEVKIMEMTWSQSLRAEGMEKGLELGRLEGMRALVGGLLERRFGPLPAGVQERLETITSPEELSRLHERALDAGTLDELGL